MVLAYLLAGLPLVVVNVVGVKQSGRRRAVVVSLVSLVTARASGRRTFVRDAVE